VLEDRYTRLGFALHRLRRLLREADPSLPDDLAGDFVRRWPNAFLLAVLLNRVVRAESAWRAPWLLQQRLGHLDVERIAALSEVELAAVLGAPPALHRFPRQMARNIREAARRLVDHYEGDAAGIWMGSPPAAVVVARLQEFRGVGQKIANMATMLLVQQFHVPLTDLSGIDVACDVHVRRVFRRTGLAPRGRTKEVIAAARQLSPTCPALLDLPAWVVGRTWCRPARPQCGACPLGAPTLCQSAA